MLNNNIKHKKQTNKNNLSNEMSIISFTALVYHSL